MTDFNKLSISLLLIDLLGVGMIGIGFAEKFGGKVIIPPEFRFAEIEIIMIGLGFLLTLPYTIYTLKKNLAKRKPSAK